MSAMLLSYNQSLLNEFIIFVSVIMTCFLISRTRILPSLDNAMGRYAHIDGLRGLAALCVFMNHLPMMLSLMDIITTRFSFPNFKIQAGLGALGVQTFFCITGFLFTEKILKAKTELNWGVFFVHRLRRLVPLYFFAVTMAIIFAFVIRKPMLINIGHTFVDSLKLYAFDFISFQPIFGFNMYHVLGNAWSLPFEWRFYLLMPVFFWLIKGNWKWPFTLILIIAIIDLSATQLAAWPFFIGGFIAALITNKMSLKKTSNKKICGLAAIAILLIPFIAGPHYYGPFRWICTCVGFILLMLAEPAILKLRTLRFLGEISYSFYLLGILFPYGFFYYVMRGLVVTGMSFHVFLRWQIWISVSFVLLCTLTFRCIEYPFLRKKNPLTENKLKLLPRWL